ncbi:unnamed protein product [Phyllotreta striolata]|uniref:Zinc-finger domain-containing protein n=1 Tax=Phyllotreta striolata TaxID=444603 RepID=A0A9N9TN53_PHYSR|nr:unnamed protein product [Phyllotreta striolata]
MSKSPETVPEEGEIVDDDFEEISDNSIILNETGKSLSPKDHLPVISLSSVSEDDSVSYKKVKRYRKFHHHHHHRHHRKLRRKSDDKSLERCRRRKTWKRLMNGSTSSSSGSSESTSDYSFDIELDRKLQTQLKATVHVEKDDDCFKNSLKSRLRAMTNPEDVEESKQSDKEKEEIDDELIQLRLEALKTAVLNKFEHRKKRKVKEMEENRLKEEIDKENTSNDNIPSKKLCPDMNPIPPDEDEDVLRALLLASMSKKITKEVEIVKKPSNNTQTKDVKYTKKAPVQLTRHFQPKIKPIIININNDSDSEEESVSNTNTSNLNKDIESSVEKFLKEQRAKVEAQSKPRLTVNDSAILEKSAVKLLPKNKQIEYQKLLLKLKNAQKRPRVRKPSLRKTTTAAEAPDAKVIEHQPVTSNKPEKPKPTVPNIKHDAWILQNALKQMQTQINGRLQIEEKYVVLTPVIKKINESTTERKKLSQEMKRLVDELARVKAKLQDTHKVFSSNVGELLKRKAEIDESSKEKDKLPVTSTPIKSVLPAEPFQIGTVPSTPIPKDAPDILRKDDDSTGNVKKEENVLRYVSPLDSVKRIDKHNPFEIMCPYDTDGNCRDTECCYKHFAR